MRQHSASTAHTTLTVADVTAPSSFAPITAQTLALVQPQVTATPQLAATATPTVTQFVNAALNEYVINGTPTGMHAFTYQGKVVSDTDNSTGMSAQVWVTPQKQIIIAYQGTTGGLNLLTNPMIVIPQLIADFGIGTSQVTSEEQSALTFAKSVVQMAKSEGITDKNIFLTGHSLGGIDAEYVSSQTGLGGVGFEATGLPVGKTVGNGANFVNVVTYGDPIGSFASDIKGLQPVAATYKAGGGTLPHFGSIVTIGNASDQAKMSADAAKFNDGNLLDQLGVFANLAGMFVSFHDPLTQANDLGVSVGLGAASGSVFDVANDSVSQLITAAQHAGRYLHG